MILRATLLVFILSVQSGLAEQLESAEDPGLYGPEALKQDFNELYASLQIANADLFAFTSREAFDAHFSRILSELDQPLSRFDAEMLFQRFVSLAHQSHTRVESDYAGFFAYLEDGGTAFPFRVAMDGEEFLVAENRSGIESIRPGDRILAIGGESVDALLPRLRSRVSAESDDFAAVLLEIYMPLLLWLEQQRDDIASVTIEHADGGQKSYPLSAAAEAIADPEPQEEPFSLAGREARMLSDSLAYLRPGPFHSTGEGEGTYDLETFSAFIDRAFGEFLDKGAEQLILDLRDNPGGDNSFSDPVIAWFADRPFRFSSDFRVRVSPQSTAANQARLDANPDATNTVSRRYANLYANREAGELVRFPIAEVEPRPAPRFGGKVYVLVNRYSFSNAVSAAALIQDYDFAMIMGEATVDMATTYGAMEQFALPNTGIVVSYPKALIIRPNGEEQPHPITPDVLLPSPRIRGSEDVMLEAAMRYLTDQGHANAVQ